MAGTNTPSDEYDTYRDTGWRIRICIRDSRIHFFSEAKLGNGLSVLGYACTMYSAQKFHFANLVYSNTIDIVYLIYKCNYSSFAVRTTSLHHQLKRKQQQYWRHLPDCLESVPMSCLSLSFNYRKWVVEAEKRLDSIRGIVTSKRMQAWFAVFSTIHSRILLTECASESLYSVQNITVHRIRLIFDSKNTLVYRLGTT